MGSWQRRGSAGGKQFQEHKAYAAVDNPFVTLGNPAVGHQHASPRGLTFPLPSFECPHLCWIHLDCPQCICVCHITLTCSPVMLLCVLWDCWLAHSPPLLLRARCLLPWDTFPASCSNSLPPLLSRRSRIFITYLSHPLTVILD